MTTISTKPTFYRYVLPVLALGFLLLGVLPPSTTDFFGVSAASASTAPAPAMPEPPGPSRSLTLLPGDDAIGPAALEQGVPQIAAGAGGYLVVWEDSRTNYAGFHSLALPEGGSAGGQTMKDIYAARLDANGELIDTIPIIVWQATWDQATPRVAWNGQNWLVVWDNQNVAGATYTGDIMAARVSPQGVVLDNPPIVVEGASDAVDEMYPAVASDGNDWVVLWMDQGSYYELRAARVAPDGAVRDPGGVAIYTPGFPDAPYNARIASARDEHLVVWQEWGSSDDDIVGLRLNTSLQRIGGVFNISTALGYQESPAVASNGTDFFVAWRDNRDLQTYGSYGARVSHSGQVLDLNGLFLSGNNWGWPTPELGWDGTSWYAAWDTYDGDARVARISANGSVLDPGGRLVSSGYARQPTLVGVPGGGVRVVWTDTRLGDGNIYGTLLAADGSVDPAAAISLGAPSQQRHRIASSGNGYLVAFLSRVSGETRIKIQRLDANGNPLDLEPVTIAGNSRSLVNPAVAWNGSLYLVTWEDFSTGSGYALGQVFGKRVAVDGTALDATPISIMPGNAPKVAALGDTFLVVATHEPINHYRNPKAARVRGTDGAVLGSPLTLGSSYATGIDVAAFGSRWLATWQHNPTHDNPAASAYAGFVNPDGIFGAEFVVSSAAKAPKVAVGPSQGLILFFRIGPGNTTIGDLYARRILPDGALLDSSTGFQVTFASGAQHLPAVAWNGAEYVVAYEDWRNVAYLDRPVSDVYATRVDANGTVLDPSGFAIANNLAVPEVLVEVTALDNSNNGYLVSYADFVPGEPYGAYRLNLRRFTLATPTPTATPAVANVLRGHVTWQGINQPNSRNAGITATLTLCVGGVPQSYSTSTDASGYFTVTTGLANGAYNYSIKGMINLANAGSLTIGGISNQEMGLMRGGDANNNNLVNAQDFNILRAVFGTSSDLRADFNRDEVVNSLDFNILRSSFGEAGASLACP